MLQGARLQRVRERGRGDRHVPVLRRGPVAAAGGGGLLERRGDRARAFEELGVIPIRQQYLETIVIKNGSGRRRHLLVRVLLLAVVDGPARARRGPRELRALELDGLELELAALLGLGHLVVEVLGRQRLLGLALALAGQQPRLDGVPRDGFVVLGLLPRRPARWLRVASRGGSPRRAAGERRGRHRRRRGACVLCGGDGEAVARRHGAAPVVGQPHRCM